MPNKCKKKHLVNYISYGLKDLFWIRASRPPPYPGPSSYQPLQERKYPPFNWSSSNSIELKSNPSSFLGNRFHPYSHPGAGPRGGFGGEGLKPPPPAAKSCKHKLRAFAFEVDLLDFARIAKVNDVNIDVLTPYDPNLKNIREITVRLGLIKCYWYVFLNIFFSSSGPDSCVFNAKLDILSGINAARKVHNHYES